MEHTGYRHIKTIQKMERLNLVYAADEKGVGGASHEYTIVLARRNQEVPVDTHRIVFQNGHRNDPDATTGVLDADLLEIVRDRLKGFQAGEFASDENAETLHHVEEALKYMNKRVEDRIARDVLGTYSK